MPDAKISSLTAVTAPLAADEFAVNEAGTSKKMTLAQMSGALSSDETVQDNELLLQADVTLLGMDTSLIFAAGVDRAMTGSYTVDRLWVPLNNYRLQYADLIVDALNEAVLDGELVLFDFGPQDIVVS